MSSPSVFKLTPSFIESVSLLNQLDEAVLSPVLTRLLDHLIHHTNSNQAAFKPNEINALHSRLVCQSLSISISQLNTQIAFLTYLFETAAYHSLNTAKFQHYLTEAFNQSIPTANQSNIELIVRSYSEKRDALPASLMNQSINQSVMTDLSWRLHVPLYQSIDQTSNNQTNKQPNKVIIPTVQEAANQTNVILKIVTNSSSNNTANKQASAQSNSQPNSLIMSLNHEQLQSLYENLEVVQKQLDALTERR